MTREELRTDLARRLEESTSSPVFFSEDDLNDALNEGYMEMSDETEWYEVWRTIDVLYARPYYDLRTAFADVEVLTPGRAFHEQTNRWLIPSATLDLDRGYSRWEQVRGYAQRVLVRGLFWLGYWPLMAAADGTHTVKQYATALPPTMDEDTDEPGFQEVFHPGLVEYALAILLPQLGETTKALTAWGRYVAYESGLKDFLEGRGLTPQFQGHVSNAG